MGLLSWVALISLFFYLTPFLRLLSRPLRALLAPKNKFFPVSFHPFLVRIGRLEYLLGPFRDRMLSVILLSIVVYLWLYESPLSQETLIASSLIVFYNLLAIITIRYRDGTRLKLAEIARCHSNTHPDDFFRLFYISLSPWPPTFPVSGLRDIDFRDTDYRSGKPPVLSRWPIVESALATSTLARMAIPGALCVIRPPPSTPAIFKVSWLAPPRQRNASLSVQYFSTPPPFTCARFPR